MVSKYFMAPGSIADNILMPNCPNLMSVGQRVLNAGFTHICVREKFPCCISPCCKMTIIFDVNGVTPWYSPCMEELEETMLGIFDLASDLFRKTCGIMVGKDGLLFIDIPPVPGAVTESGTKTQEIGAWTTQNRTHERFRRYCNRRFFSYWKRNMYMS